MTSTLREEQQHSESPPPYPVRRWTLDEYHALIEQGMFDDERVELLEGWIVPKMTRNPLHDTTLTFVEEALRPLLAGAVYLRSQQAVTFATSEPEPDLAVVRGSARNYRQQHPGKGDILLVVEIADASLSKDRRKRAIYSAAEVPVYWIVNLNEQVIEVYSEPDLADQKYRQQTRFEMGMNVPLSLPGVAGVVPMNDIFPKD